MNRAPRLEKVWRKLEYSRVKSRGVEAGAEDAEVRGRLAGGLADGGELAGRVVSKWR